MNIGKKTPITIYTSDRQKNISFSMETFDDGFLLSLVKYDKDIVEHEKLTPFYNNIK